MSDVRTSQSSSPSLERRIGYALLTAGAVEGTLVCTDDGLIEHADRATADLLGGDVSAFRGTHLNDLLARLGDETLRLRFHSALLGAASIEFVVERPGRTDEWIEVRTLPLGPGMAYLLRDITDRERAERALRRKEQRLLAANLSLRLAHKAAHAASWEWRVGKNVRWLDLAAARQLAGLPTAWTESDEVEDWRNMLPAHTQPDFDKAITALESEGSATFDVEVVGADGRLHWMKLDAAVTERGTDGLPSRVNGVVVDVTSAKVSDAFLRAEVAERKRAEERQQLLIHELNHRVKNMLATVQSIARQTLGALESSAPAGEFEERLMALAWAYEILTRERWAGAPLREVLSRTMAPHAPSGSGRVSLDGPPLWLQPNKALAIAMATHELATNAAKYGALSTDKGSITIHWRVATDDGAAPRLEIDWIEAGGPAVTAPQRRGFGTRLVERSLARELGGAVAIRFEPQGVHCLIAAPLDQVAEVPAASVPGTAAEPSG